MKSLFSLALILTASISSADDLIVRYEGVGKTPVKKHEVKLDAELSLKQSLENFTVKTSRDQDMRDPDRINNDYYCVTTVSGQAGTAKFTVEHKGSVKTKTVAIQVSGSVISKDDGKCETPNLGEGKTLAFSAYTSDSRFSIVERTRRKDSQFEISFPFLAEGFLSVVKNTKDDKYENVAISYSEKQNVIRIFPETLTAYTAHYAPQLGEQGKIVLKIK